MMTELNDAANQLVKKHSVLILKRTFSSIRKLDEKIENVTQRKLALGISASGVRSSAHWKSVASFQQYYAEREQLYKELQELNDLTNFIGNLHQDRYKFVHKYQDIMEVVRNKNGKQSYGTEKNDQYQRRLQMKKCKFCESDKGVFVKERYAGSYHYQYKFDGQDVGNQGIFNNLSVVRGKHVYCIECEKRLMPLSEFEERFQ